MSVSKKYIWISLRCENSAIELLIPILGAMRVRMESLSLTRIEEIIFKTSHCQTYAHFNSFTYHALDLQSSHEKDNAHFLFQKY
jgi:hypothetical protein